MTDRELLELAAKAVGIIESKGPLGSDLGILIDITPPTALSANCVVWNPLTNDGDALRLAVKLHIDIRHFMYERGYMDCLVDRIGKRAVEELGNDPFSATRRAIVRAAAEIGRNNGEGEKLSSECLECGGTGLRDSGGFHPWGEAAPVPCDCGAWEKQ